jgi:hypothetical protein
LSFSTIAQSDTTNKLSYTAFIDAYYVFDFNQPKNNSRSAAFYNYNRHNQVGINLGYFKIAYDYQKIRANFAIAAGTYMQDNLGSEPELLRNIFEANLGFKIKKNWWLDVGVFPSHIGFESAITKDCWNLSRSLCAENTPYYESGAKISHTNKSKKWFFSLLYLNGWQRIQRLEGQTLPSFGSQITFKPNDRLSINHSSFVGFMNPDTMAVLRVFNNFYFIYQITERFGLTMGFDYGQQQKSKNDSKLNYWFSNTLVAKFKLTEHFAVAGRSEYYGDPSNITIPTYTGGFNVFGNSINLDYTPQNNFLIRIEGRLLMADASIFLNKGKTFQNKNSFVSTSFSYQF